MERGTGARLRPCSRSPDLARVGPLRWPTSPTRWERAGRDGRSVTRHPRGREDAALIGIAFALVDWWVTRQAHRSKHKMTKSEVKREHRESEGDPQLKAARHRAHHEMLAAATINAVRDATVVIVNPEHLATALRYLDGEDEAPTVVAAGDGDLALRIREAARAYGIPVIRDVPVAHALRDLRGGRYHSRGALRGGRRDFARGVGGRTAPYRAGPGYGVFCSANVCHLRAAPGCPAASERRRKKRAQAFSPRGSLASRARASASSVESKASIGRPDAASAIP